MPAGSRVMVHFSKGCGIHPGVKLRMYGYILNIAQPQNKDYMQTVGFQTVALFAADRTVPIKTFYVIYFVHITGLGQGLPPLPIII